MPKNTKDFNKNLEGFLVANDFSNLSLLDVNGASVPDASKADMFKFNYSKGDKDYGTVVLTTHGGRITVYYNESAVRGTGRIDSGWTDFLAKLKDWALRYGQMGFDTKNIDKLGREMEKRKEQKREEQLLEGYYGNRNTSYSDNVPTIKIVIKHSRPLGEGDLRYHNIDKIFLENDHGERILVPSKKPSVGRAFARHLAEGGQYNDERWNHIKEIAEDVSKLGGFVRATKTGQFNEGIQSVVEGAKEHYNNLRETIKRLASTRGYNNYFESWQPTLMENGGDSIVPDMFTTQNLDPRIERALPVINRLNITVKEISEAQQFAEWADSIVESDTPEDIKEVKDLVELLKSEELPAGPDAINIKGLLFDFIDNPSDRSDLFDELEVLARANPDNDSKPTIIAWLQKNSSNEEYAKVLAEIGEEPLGSSGAEEPDESEVAAQPEPEQPAPVTEGDLLEKKAKSVQQKPRNFVAKHAKTSGAGSHSKKGHQRHDKHKKKLGEAGDELAAIIRLSNFK